ncbi:lipid-A-disaccharide synthase N-terminal domain-containing protein [Ferrovibrio sp.]|uniref:lipid-A-disaccharide synthase N-terminal domain-containing protein n=1 Tax=Ferrovibrio sp. TaxID=1917215 RepID=UPI00311D3211
MTALLAEYWDRLEDSLNFWAVIGFLGQAIFASRFIIQWLHAERVRRSEIPLAFWYISIAGGVTLLFYAIHIANMVFIVGQASGLFVYLRNLHLIYKARRAAAEIKA